MSRLSRIGYNNFFKLTPPLYHKVFMDIKYVVYFPGYYINLPVGPIYSIIIHLKYMRKGI